MRKGFLYLFTFAIIILSLASCSATKYVPDGSYLLDEVGTYLVAVHEASDRMIMAKVNK